MESINLNTTQEIIPSDLSIEELDISLRTFQALKNANILTLGDIISHEESYFTLENIKGFFPRSKEEIIDVIKTKGLKFKQ